jgi:hypothetical protein
VVFFCFKRSGISSTGLAQAKKFLSLLTKNDRINNKKSGTIEITFNLKMNEKLKLFKLLVHWILCQMLSDIAVVKSSSGGFFNDLTTGKWT